MKFCASGSRLSRRNTLTKAVVITFDRWHAGFLGCYGNPWVDTPHLDKLAVRGTVFDQHFAEDLSPSPKQHAWWTGRYQFPLDASRQQLEPSWLPLLKSHGIATTLLRDPAATVPLSAEQFDTPRGIALDDVAGLHHEEDAPRFVRAAVSRLKKMAEAPPQRELFWVHAGGLPVDASSSAYEELYSDGVGDGTDRDESRPSDADSDADDEESFPDFPRFWRRNRASPRELAGSQLRGAGWQSAGGAATAVDWQLRRDLYSGQVTQWDAWIGRILDAVSELRQRVPLMLIFASAAGEHLGEHAAIEPSSDLFEEQIHLPLIIELPLDEAYSGRRRQLTQSVDLPATILDWFDLQRPPGYAIDGSSLLPVIREDVSLPRLAAYCGNASFGGARTSEYYYRQQLAADGPEPREMVFLKPDDRWDADNMLRQYIDTADELATQWREFAATIRNRPIQ